MRETTPLEDWPEVALSDGPTPFVLQVTDLKQWLYCPRIVYFTYNWPGVRPTVYHIEEGRLRHEEERERLRRRRRRRLFGLPPGEYLFDVWHLSETLRLSGRVDLVILGEDEAIPVDFKDSVRPQASHFRWQLIAYALLVEEKLARPVRRGFVYSLPRRRAHEVRITPRGRNRVKHTLHEMVQVLQSEALPPGPESTAPCVACEFRRFCNDRF